MEKLHERTAIKGDKPLPISFPRIGKKEVPLVLIYEASTELHQIGLKARIVEFLHGKSITTESYTNSSIHFTMKGGYSKTTLDSLNTAISILFEKLQREYKGKVFWTLQYLVKFEDEPQEAAIVGVGNRTFSDMFSKRFADFITSLLFQTKKKKVL